MSDTSNAALTEAVAVLAPAKVNLTLHVTGQRADGYHMLDSLVAFAPVGDRLTLRGAPDLTLALEGPEAGDLPLPDDNLVLRAARILPCGGRGAAITLEKHLPVASGIGGGSADAAATLRGLMALWQMAELAEAEDDALAPISKALVGLGADVPMCLISHPLRARGIGEDIQLAELPPLPAVLINPRCPVSTPEMFRRLQVRDNPPMAPALPRFEDAAACIDWLAAQRNDLQAPAIEAAPAIGQVLCALANSGAALARMSGSGATCFGLFEDLSGADTAAKHIAALYPDWWVVPTWLGDQSDLAMPRPL